MERRNSARLPFPVKVQETNGEYLYNWSALNLSEEGIFLSNKVCFSDQDPFSKVSFTLPNGQMLVNVTARVVREARRGTQPGCALEFLNLTEDQRLELKRFMIERAAS